MFNASTRQAIALVVFVLDALVCGIWAYREASAMLDVLSGTGSGGIAGVSAGDDRSAVHHCATDHHHLADTSLRIHAFGKALAQRASGCHLALVILP